ncbi:sensor histidine kinase [Paenibacillus qinlingensis]|uniref:sensor histidine kinase n=1 Tax=Paenibacillus qinlingensis TaxID=1837343 RepID=UPI001566842C|nr:histidine kinase [Paenibacillus qinlingensis]NQX59679.1 histidine kinase [Paenibacillus qinlingensis]
MIKRKALSINAKLVCIILFFLCVPLLAFGTVWYSSSTESIEKNAIGYSDQLVRQINGQLDSYFGDLQRVTYPLLLHPQIQTFMKLDPNDQYARFVNNKQISDELFPTIVFGRTDIYGLSIVSKNGMVTTNNNAIAAKASYDLYKDMLTGDQNYKITGLSVTESTTVLTIIRKFVDTISYQSTGMLVVHVRLNEIIKICDKIKLGRSGFVWIMDQDGKVVYHPDKEKWGKAVNLQNIPLTQNEPNGYSVVMINGIKKLILADRSPLTGWTLVSEVPLNELNGDLVRWRNVTVWVGLLLVSLALFLVGGFSVYLTQSLSHLRRLMRRAEEGDLHVRAPEKRNDEIGGLNRSFNRMVEEIQRLIGEIQHSRQKEIEMELRQRESALLVMQSQINPHFLYNTLEIINSYAIIEGVKPISRMATSLADIFRYSIGHPQQSVTLKEELRYISTYLEIQQERFKSLRVELKIHDEDIHSVLALRLMIQPLVENAFKHGYERHRIKPTYIGIIGEHSEEGYLLRIVDEGRGMDNELKNEYNQAFNSNEINSHKDSDVRTDGSSESIGLWNVHQRIRLSFGSPCGLYIAKSNETGTIIELMLKYTTDNK